MGSLPLYGGAFARSYSVSMNCLRRFRDSRRFRELGKKKTNKHKEFWRDTPWFVSRLSPVICPVCPLDILPLECEFPHKSAQTCRMSLGRPEFIPGTLPGHSHHQIPLCDLSLSVYLFSIVKATGLQNIGLADHSFRNARTAPWHPDMLQVGHSFLKDQVLSETARRQ